MPKIARRSTRGGARGGVRGRSVRGGRIRAGFSTRGRGGSRPFRRQTEDVEAVIMDLDVDKDATDFFTKNASFDQHYEAQQKNRDRYVATAMGLHDYSTEIVPNARARSLAAAFARNDKPLLDLYLSHAKKFANFGFVDVLKALTILDAKREKKCLEKKLERINTKTSSVMKQRKQGVCVYIYI